VTRPFGPKGLDSAFKTLLFCGNGYLGVQASVPGRDRPAGTFINGFYETAPITYGEKAFGYPARQQVMIPLADILTWTIEEETDGEWESLNLTEGFIELNMQRGIRTLNSMIPTAGGGQLSLKEEVMTPFSHPHRLCSRITLSGKGRFRVTRILSSPETEAEESDDPRKMESLGEEVFGKSRFYFEPPYCFIEQTTAKSALTYACSAGPVTEDDKVSVREGEHSLAVIRIMNPDEKKSESWVFSGSFCSSLEEINPLQTSLKIQQDSAGETWEKWEKEQAANLDKFWRRGDIILEESPGQTCALRFSTFGIIQSTGTDSRKSAAAKGLSSSGYNGHYFWDADIYVQGALSNLDHDRAGALAAYRIAHLEEARLRARELSEKGALYPWRTINGHECSAFFPAGTAQFHINADIIWGMKEYIDNSGDIEILLRGGAEMLLETARFWAGFAVDVPVKGYCLHCVTGPDEYTALVNNNFYTNLMAREHLKYACRILELLDLKYPLEASALKERIDLQPEEPVLWQDMSRRFYLPEEEGTGIYMQDDSFSEKSPWDWASTPRENRPLLLHYHPLKIYRHKVMKQPDVVMGLILQRQYFDEKTIGLNFDYYDPLTSGDSSLSSAVQAIAAALAGKMAEGEEHFRKNLFLDLENREGNTDNGIHLAAMAGSRMAVLYGFAGYRITDRGPVLSPRFPASWGRVTFSIVYKGIVIRVDYDPHKMKISLTGSDAVEISVNNVMIHLEKAGTVHVSLNG